MKIPRIDLSFNTMYRFKICLSFYLFITVTFSYAQKSHLKFEQLGINEGLSQSTVRCIFQDSKGFMWFGTKDGLNKYDGYKFTIYKKDPSNPNSLASNDIKSIVDDRSGKLWIATWDGGLNVYDPKTEQFHQYLNKPGSKGISSNFLETLMRDGSNNIWIGTADKGLDFFDNLTHRFINYRSNKFDTGTISDNNVSAIVEDSYGNIWVGTAKGLNVFDKRSGKFRRLMHKADDPHSLSDDHIKFIYEDTRKNLWIGTYGGGLNKFDRASGQFQVFRKENSSLSSNALLSINEDNTGNLWIGTENGGLDLFEPLKNTAQTVIYANEDPSSLSSNTINTIFKDKKGNLWLGTTNGGIDLLKRGGENFVHYKHEQGQNSLSNNIVNCVFEDSKNNIWIGTDGGGLNLYNSRNNHFTVYKHTQNGKSITGDYVLSVCEDKDGNLWIGTWGNGISIFNPATNTFSSIKYEPADPDGLNSNYAFYIFRDSKDRMWIGTYGNGLNLYNAKTKKFTHYVHNEKDPESLSNNNVLTINEDKQHHILVGTDGGGLSIMDPLTGRFTPYKNFDLQNSLSNNSVSSIYTDDQGIIWVGTNYGLNELNPAKHQINYFFKEQGLPSNRIAGVLPDKHHNLWISTDDGLSKFNLRSKVFKNYTYADGLQANEFKYARCLSRSGRMYFGGVNGFNEFHPDSIQDLSYDPPIVFTDLQIFNKHLDVSRDKKTGEMLNLNVSYAPEIELSYKQSVITFEFASLNFVNKEKKQYRYILEGFDTQWHYLGTKNNLTYTNLDHGTYTLKINGFTNTGAYSSKIATLKIRITPPYWRTWWFESLVFLILAALFAALFYLRVRAIKERNRQLEGEVTKRTQQLKETNRALTINNEQIKLQHNKLEVFNKEISEKSDKILKQQEQIVIQNTQLENTVDQLKRSNYTKDRFLSILAHDLRNPITAIAGIAKNLVTQVPQLNKIEIAKYMTSISDSSKSVLDLLLNLLEWAKTQNQTLASNPENFNLYELIAGNRLLMEQQLKNKNIYLSIDVNPDHILFADKKMTDAVIRNLLSNCIKFTPAYGQISISSKEMPADIIITFFDTGVGMTQEQMKNLFDPEKAFSSPGSNGETGSGLGLMITNEFIEVNHGKLEVSSLVNEGSTFIVSLPKGTGFEIRQPNVAAYTVAYEDTHSEKLIDQKKLKIRGKRLLYVDDNPEMVAYLRLILADTFEWFEARDGQEGIETAIACQPEVIITDMLMPVMNGLELCKKIKYNPLTSHIPVIVLTSQTDTGSQLSGYEAGADAYLMKPVNQQILFQVIYNLIINNINSRAKFINSEDVYPDSFTYNARDKDFLDNIITYIERNISQYNLDHKKLCEIANMSRTILYAKIKSLTGQGVHEFIQSIRVKKGLQLLMEGRLNINQISYEVGFNTPSYFSKCFIRQFGAPPKDYLLKLQKVVKN